MSKVKKQPTSRRLNKLMYAISLLMDQYQKLWDLRIKHKY